MERFFQPKRKCQFTEFSNCSNEASNPTPTATSSVQRLTPNDNIERSRVQLNVDDLESDPGKRPPIDSYDANIRDDVRMMYLEKGPFQPHGHDFPRRMMGKDNRCFRKEWFSEFYWLEYSIEKDAAYCLYCYLFKLDRGGQGGGYAFTKIDFRDWKHKKTLNNHVGCVNSAHNEAFAKCTNLMNQRQSISFALSNQSSNQQKLYRTRLTASLDCVKFLLKQGLAFCGHDESEESLNRGNFLELLDWYAACCEEIKGVVLGNALGNDQMTAPRVQKDLVNYCAIETTRAIMKEMGNSLFSILVDESRDNSVKEQMAIVLRFVDINGELKERFLGICHVTDTCAQSLKDAIDTIFSRHGLSISSLRGQGYDGTSNMSGEFNGLKALILRENPYAFYVHCFAHQLQLALVFVACRNDTLGDFCNMLTIIVNLVGSSCKRVDALRSSYQSEILIKLNVGELCSGSGRFQDLSLACPRDTRWGSHLLTLTCFISMFNNIIDVLENVSQDGINPDQRSMATRQMNTMQDFEFVFSLHLMFEILAITDDLSQALQRKDQDIQNAIMFLDLCKHSLQNTRDNGWDNLLKTVTEFSVCRNIVLPNMEDIVVVKGRPRRGAQQLTYYHRFYVDLYCHVIDSILQELNDRFPETTTELLTCMSCLSPNASFAAFDMAKLLRLAQLYPMDFANEDIILLKPQLDKFLLLVRRDKTFFNLTSISCVSQKLVATGKHYYFPLVYRLITLVLILPVATASVERSFSAMNLIKSDLRNKMGDDWLNDNLVVYTERKIFKEIDNETILQRFQNMRPRRMQLSKLPVAN